MRLAYDATPLLGSRTGVATFTNGLLRALAAGANRSEEDLDVRAYALSWRGRRRLASALPSGVSAVTVPMPAAPLLRAWRGSSWPPAETFVGDVDVVHGTNYVVPPTRRAGAVVTVYDLTSVRYPELCAPASLRYPALVRAAVDRGALVHVLAQAIGDEVCELLGVPAERVRVVPSGLDAPVAGDPAGGRRMAGRDAYVLALGTVEPRKRIDTLIEAFDRVAPAHPDLALVIAGPDGWRVDEIVARIDASPHRARIRRIGWVDDERRADLLAGATVLAVPSLYEGFGYPPLEAMVMGVPVVATSAGSLPEVLGDAAWFVDAGDHHGVADAIASIVDDAAKRDEMSRAGKAHAATFSWDECAAAMVEVYRDAVRAR